jgi:LPS export ABC transporter protein LptC
LKRSNYILNKLYIAVLVSGTALFFSCRDNIDIINRSIDENTPTQTAEDFTTNYTDSALTKLRMEAPLMEYYGKMEEPYSDFPQGIIVYFYDGNDEPSGHISAKFGRYFEAKHLWEVRDSVVALNEKNELLETELLFWDEENDLIYTDKFVKITQKDQIIRGYGLESDPRFLKWIIKNVTATLYMDDE